MTTWPKDGGPFITLPIVITRDPDIGRAQRRLYRMQLRGPRETAMHWQMHKTGARHFRRAKELGMKRLEVAVALGGDPALTYAATAPLPDGLDEFMFAGFLAQAGRQAGRLHERQPRGARRLGLRARGVRRPERAAVRRRAVRRPHRLLHAGRRRARSST